MVVALLGACTAGDPPPADPDALPSDEAAGIQLDEWGAVIGSALAREPTGSFEIVQDEAEDFEPEPTEEEADAPIESPPEEDPEALALDDEGDVFDESEGEDVEDALVTETQPLVAARGDGLVEVADPARPDDGDVPALAEREPPRTEGVASGTPATTTRRAWIAAPSGRPIFLNGVNTVYSDANAVIGPYLRSHTIQGEWARLSSRAGWGLNWVGSWVSGDNPILSTGTRLSNGHLKGLVPYGVVLRLTPEAVLRRASAGACASGSSPPTLRADGQPMSARGHWLRDPDLAGGHTVLCGGVGRHRYGDPFNPDYIREAQCELRGQVARHRLNDHLVVYYMDNEQGIGDRTRARPLSGRTRHDEPWCARGDGQLDLRRFLWTECPQDSSIDAPFCAPHAFGAFLRDRYGTPGALNAAWGTSYAGFDAVLAARPKPGRCAGHAAGANARCDDDLADFALVLVRQYVRLTTEAIRQADTRDDAGAVVRTRARPISAPRLALGGDRTFHFYSLGRRADRWTTGGEVPDPHDRRDTIPADRRAAHFARYPVLHAAQVRFDPYRAFGRFREEPGVGFDLVSVNVYTGAARFPETWLRTGFGRIRAAARLPVLVSEFGLRLRDTCWNNAGGAGSFVGATAPYTSDDPRDVERGRRYRSQVQQFIRLGAIGASWHRWVDDQRGRGTQRVARCDDEPRVLGQRKGLLRGNGARYVGLYDGVHGFTVSLYGRVRSQRAWWR